MATLTPPTAPSSPGSPSPRPTRLGAGPRRAGSRVGGCAWAPTPGEPGEATPGPAGEGGASRASPQLPATSPDAHACVSAAWLAFAGSFPEFRIPQYVLATLGPPRPSCVTPTRRPVALPCPRHRTRLASYLLPSPPERPFHLRTGGVPWGFSASQQGSARGARDQTLGSTLQVAVCTVFIITDNVAGNTTACYSCAFFCF